MDKISRELDGSKRRETLQGRGGDRENILCLVRFAHLPDPTPCASRSLHSPVLSRALKNRETPVNSLRCRLLEVRAQPFILLSGKSYKVSGQRTQHSDTHPVTGRGSNLAPVVRRLDNAIHRINPVSSR